MEVGQGPNWGCRAKGKKEIVNKIGPKQLIEGNFSYAILRI
jgi:hypothetical protein